MNTSNRSKAKKGKTPPAEASGIDEALTDELNYGEAHAALELALAQLQAEDLAVEEMAGLYQRAQAYAGRCEQLLQQVEQSIRLWDPQEPESAPQTFSSEIHGQPGQP